MDIFASLQVSCKWEVENTRNFVKEEIAAVDTAEVVETKYGLAVCFHMKGNKPDVFIPLYSESNAKIGDRVNLETAKFITLTRDGDTIYRVLV